MNRKVIIQSTTDQKTYTLDNVPSKISYESFCSLAADNGVRLNNCVVKVAGMFAGDKGNWVLEPGEELPSDNGLILYLVEAKTKAGY